MAPNPRSFKRSSGWIVAYSSLGTDGSWILARWCRTLAARGAGKSKAGALKGGTGDTSNPEITDDDIPFQLSRVKTCFYRGHVLDCSHESSLGYEWTPALGYIRTRPNQDRQRTRLHSNFLGLCYCCRQQIHLDRRAAAG